MVCCDDEPLPRALVLDQLEHAEPRKAVAAEFLAAGHHIVAGGVANCMYCHGRRVRNRWHGMPATCIRDTYEQRKHPQPQNGRGDGPAMAMYQTRHDFFDIADSTYFKRARAL